VIAGAVRDAVASVCDPEYPDVSIADLGLVESIEIDPDGTARIGLIPTVSGCPALEVIAADVAEAVGGVPGVRRCDVAWLRTPTWSRDRITEAARRVLADDYTVVVRPPTGRLHCPVCGGDQLDDHGAAGPTRCRTTAWCRTCRNVVEVVR
jgi:ring-1,2-phenylacetyl-CoA epoxidase subunit PaaD